MVDPAEKRRHDLIGLRMEIEGWFDALSLLKINLNYEETSMGHTMTHEPMIMREAHLLIEKSFKLLADDPKHGHRLGIFYQKFKAKLPQQAKVLEAAYTEALEWYRYGKHRVSYGPYGTPDYEVGIDTLQGYMDKHGTGKHYEGFKYPHELDKSSYWLRAILPLHYEILRCLQDVVAQEHGATHVVVGSIRQRVNSEIEGAFSGFDGTDKPLLSEVAGDSSAAPADAYRQVAGMGFIVEDIELENAIKKVHHQLLEHSDLAVRFFARTTVTVPKGVYTLNPELDVVPLDQRMYTPLGRDGQHLGHVERIRTGAWAWGKFGPPYAYAVAADVEDAIKSLAEYESVPAVITRKDGITAALLRQDTPQRVDDRSAHHLCFWDKHGCQVGESVTVDTYWNRKSSPHLYRIEGIIMGGDEYYMDVLGLDFPIHPCKNDRCICAPMQSYVQTNHDSWKFAPPRPHR